MERVTMNEERARTPVCGDEKCPINLERQWILCSISSCAVCKEQRKLRDLAKENQSH